MMNLEGNNVDMVAEEATYITHMEGVKLVIMEDSGISVTISGITNSSVITTMATPIILSSREVTMSFRTISKLVIMVGRRTEAITRQVDKEMINSRITIIVNYRVMSMMIAETTIPIVLRKWLIRCHLSSVTLIPLQVSHTN